ncbi:MAG: hypothetical protein RLZZ164_752 [Actinomycetota bacterium]
MSNQAADPGHGDTPAAWVTVIALMLASGVATAGIWFDNNSALLISAVVVAVAGSAAGFALAKLGYGKGGAKLKSKH